MPFKHKVVLPFVRTSEPSFVPKLNLRFNVSVDHMNDRYKGIGLELSERFGDESWNTDISKTPTLTVPVKPMKLPDLSFPKRLKRNAQFSVFLALHTQYAEYLMRIFDDCKDIDELISMALYVRDQVNSQLFTYAYSVALTHRNDTDNIELPTLLEIFPAKFVKRSSLNTAREETFVLPENLRQPIEIPFDRTSTKLDPEHELAFFREDIGVNSHHWHWHYIYPTGGPDPKYYDKDRRGELFYYMHQQILARYNTIRLAHDLPVTEAFSDFRQVIENGYYSKMSTTTSVRNIPPRQNNVYLHDLRRDADAVVLKVSDLERSRDRIIECIDQGFVYDKNGKRIDLNNFTGIDILGNLIERSSLSVNSRFYGNLHNSGHILIAFCHDPDLMFNEDGAVMNDTSTAMRDPIFYRWHQFINDLFVQHKDTLQPYTDDDLKFDKIKIEKLDVLSMKGTSTNVLKTFWQKTDANLENGLDFNGPGVLYARFTHLNYEEFSYKITVENSATVAQKGTIRIFLIPLSNEAKELFFFEGSRKLSIELDRFVVNLQPGINKIIRKSTESAVTIPFDRIFPKIERTESGEVLPSTEPDDIKNFCSCGWPEHMLLPKGSIDGYPCRLFVMISDYSKDEIKQPPSIGECIDSIVFCGLRNRKYPDARSMGFPFDRPANYDTYEFTDFLTNRNNMSTKIVQIRHINEVLKTVSVDNLEVVDNNKQTITKKTGTASTT